MAILLIEHNGDIVGSALKGRVLIGRRAGNHVILDDPAVSRIHAWIDTADRRFCVTDAGSRTGTFVNGKRLQGKTDLNDGDRIQVGPARLTFRARAALPAGVSQLDFTRHDQLADAGAQIVDGGILFDCSNCHAPLWIPNVHGGRLGKCRFCAAVVRIPQPSTAAAHSNVTPAAAASLIACGVCQSPIHPNEQTTTCPDCALTFHADCWSENYGCSAYGCSQVNVLSPETAVEVLDHDATTASQLAGSEADESNAPSGGVAPEHALLAGSVLGTLLGALTFGVPALLALVACAVYAKRRRASGSGRIPPVVLAAGALSVGGILVGVAFSYYWWLRRGAFA